MTARLVLFVAVVSTALTSCTYSRSCRLEDAGCSLLAAMMFTHHRAGRFLYFTDQGGSAIYASRIQTSGSISTPWIAATLTNANGMDVDNSGTTLAVAGNGGLNFYAINPATGALTFQGIDTQITAPTVVSFDPGGRFVAATLQTNGHMLCRLNGSGGFTTCVKDSTNYQLQDLVVSPGGGFLYGATSASPSIVRAFTVNASALTATPLGSSLSTGGTVNTPAGMIMDTSGTHVYVSFVAGNPNGPYVTATLAGDGSLSSLASSTGVNGFIGGPFDPAQSTIYLNQASNSLIMAIARSANGSLTNTPGAMINVGGGPAKLTMDPQGRFLYVTNNPDINVLQIGSSSLTLFATVPATPTGFGIAIASYNEYP